MASAFETGFAAGTLPGLAGLHGATGTYTAPDSTVATSCTVMLHIAPGLAVTHDDEAAHLDRSAIAQVAVSEIATVAFGGRFAVDGANWTVTDTPVQQAGFWRSEVANRDRDSQGERRQM